MFGISKKQEERERELEQELTRQQWTADRMEQKFSEFTDRMQELWQENEQEVSALEGHRLELDHQLTQVMDAVNEASEETRRQKEQEEKRQEERKELAKQQESSSKERQQSVDELHSCQQEMTELLQQEKDGLSPAEIVAQMGVELSQEMEEMQTSTGELAELGKQMGVVSLNAAIEAGRMGESGKQFVEAAEDVRSLSGQYQQTAASLTRVLEAMETKWRQAKEQLDQIEQERKEYFRRLEKTAAALETATGELEQKLKESRELEVVSSLTESADSTEEITHCHQKAAQAVEQAGRSFRKQQETIEKLRQTAAEARVWMKNSQKDQEA